ncbi:hypothetical protein V1505DRAFT_95350 [Lipomyces doorenjongii]
MDIGTLHRRLELTAEQTAAVRDVIGRVEVLKDSGNIGSDPDSAAVDSVARLSTSVLRQQFEVVNRLLPSGESGVSQYLVPRAINLLSFRPNGSFVSYIQITHLTAAIRYALRSTMLYRVAKSIDPSIANEDGIDEECQGFLVPGKSSLSRTVYRSMRPVINSVKSTRCLRLLGRQMISQRSDCRMVQS